MKEVWKTLKRLHNDDRGAEGLEKLLLIAAIVIPLLGVLILYRDAITTWVKDLFEDMKSNADTPLDGPDS